MILLVFVKMEQQDVLLAHQGTVSELSGLTPAVAGWLGDTVATKMHSSLWCLSHK